MTRLTRWVLSHQRAVIVFWAVLTVVGIALSGKANDAFDQKFSVPDREGWNTQNAIARIYGAGGTNLPLMPVVRLPEGRTVDSPGIKAELQSVDQKTRKALPGSRVASYASTGSKAFVSDDGRTTYVYAYPKIPDTTFGDDPVSVGKLRRALRGATVR